MKSHFNGMSVSGFLQLHTRLNIGPMSLTEASVLSWLRTDLKTMFCDGKDIFDHLIKIK